MSDPENYCHPSNFFGPRPIKAPRREPGDCGCKRHPITHATKGHPPASPPATGRQPAHRPSPTGPPSGCRSPNAAARGHQAEQGKAQAADKAGIGE